jgi:hypothetical protein
MAEVDSGLQQIGDSYLAHVAPFSVSFSSERHVADPHDRFGVRAGAAMR